MQAERRFMFVLQEECSGSDASLCADRSFPIQIKEPLDVFDTLHLLHLPLHLPTLCARVIKMWFLSVFLKSAMCEFVFYDHFVLMLRYVPLIYI